MSNTIKMPEGSMDEKFQYVEDVLNGVLTHVPRVITAQIPPFPLSIFVEEPSADGSVFRYIFPVEGELLHAAVHIDDMAGQKQVIFKAHINSGLSEASESFVMDRPDNSVTFKLPITKGSRLHVTCDQPVKGIWVGMLFRVAVHHAEVLKMALEQAAYAHARIHS